MYNNKLILTIIGASLSSVCVSLERLSDSTLSNVQGQSGLTIEQSQLLNIDDLLSLIHI